MKTGEVTGKTGVVKNPTKKGKAEKEEVATRQGRSGTDSNFLVSE